MILLDTSAVIELLKGSSKGEKVKNILQKEKSAIAVITVNETLAGQTEKKEIIKEFFQSMSILPFDEPAVWKSVELEEELYKKGTPLAKLDLYIASIALANHISLVSFDTSFKHVPNLKLLLLS